MRQADEPGLINLAAGIPGLDALPTEALHCALETARTRDGAGLFAYHHPEGDHALRDLLAARLATRGVAVRGTDLITVTGCTQGLSVMISLLVQPGTVVAVEAPAYYGLLELLSAAGAQVLPLPLDGPHGLDLAATEAAFRQWKPRALFVCSSLSNPSGATLPAPARERLVELCRTHAVRIVEDDIYAELVDTGAPPPLRAFDDGSTVSYVTSFSKTVSPGLRVGFCAPGSLFEEFAARKCQWDLHSAVPTEAILREFLAAGFLDPHLASLRTRNQRRRAIAHQSIAQSFPSGTTIHEPAGGYMLWAQLPALIDLPAAAAAARTRRIAFASGNVFFANTPTTSSLRLNCARASEEDLARALQELGPLLHPTAQ